MRKSRTGKFITAAILTAAMTLGMASSVFAASDGPQIATDETSLKAAITKVLQTGAGTTIPSNMTFTFKFTQDTTVTQDSAGKDIVVMTDDVPIKDITATVTPSMTGTDSTDKTMRTYEVQTGNFLEQATDNANYTKAGIYVYKVVEELSGAYTITDATKESLTYSTAEYTLYVYVANKADGSGVYIKAIGDVLTKGQDTDGTDGKPAEGDKVDPTPGTEGTTGEVSTENSAMKFYNNYLKKGGENPLEPDQQKLFIDKTVTGDYGDHSKYFDFSLTLTKPAVSTATVYKAKVVDADGNDVTSDDNGTVIDGYLQFTPGKKGTFSLKHGQKLVFADTEVGVQYVVKETGVTNYKASAVLSHDNAAGTAIVNDSAITAEVGADLTIPLQPEDATLTAVVGNQKTSGVAYTNAYQDPTPTGIIMNNLPFFMLILLAVAGLAAFVVVKCRRRTN